MIIRKANEQDMNLLRVIAEKMGFTHEQGYFERCLSEQAAGKRVVFIADDAGYVQLIWQSAYGPFKRLDIPEIQDLNVIPDFRNQGIGGALVGYCEDMARRAGKKAMGLSVGLYARYGAAQRLYVKKGYVPDGAGIVYDDVTVKSGEMRAVDDFLTLKLIKDLI